MAQSRAMHMALQEVSGLGVSYIRARARSIVTHMVASVGPIKNRRPQSSNEKKYYYGVFGRGGGRCIQAAYSTVLTDGVGCSDCQIGKSTPNGRIYSIVSVHVLPTNEGTQTRSKRSNKKWFDPMFPAVA